jgi:hypothetical protein
MNFIMVRTIKAIARAAVKKNTLPECRRIFHGKRLCAPIFTV